MTSRLERIRNKLKEQAERGGGGSNFNQKIWPFWQMKVGQSARVRFLIDSDKDNPLEFYRDKKIHTLSINGKNEKVPCLYMYDEPCPICELSSKFYDEEGKDSKNGKYYWRNKTSLVKVLVLEDPLPPNDDGETYKGKVAITQLGFQLFGKLIADLEAPDIFEDGDDPFDVKNGFDFIIEKSPQGEHGTYTVASRFVRKPSPIPAEYMEEVEKELSLSEGIPANPGKDKVMAMLHSHLTGQAYDDKAGDEKPSGKTGKPEKQEDEDEDVPKVPSRKSESTNSNKSDDDDSPPFDTGDESGDDEDDEEGYEELLARIRKNRPS